MDALFLNTYQAILIDPELGDGISDERSTYWVIKTNLNQHYDPINNCLVISQLHNHQNMPVYSFLHNTSLFRVLAAEWIVQLLKSTTEEYKR